jgi:DNA-binding MarR family transcriptional regulator
VSRVPRRSTSVPEPLRSWTTMLLVAAAERATEYANAELAPLGLSWRDWRILALVDTLAPISQVVLAERVGIDRTTASRAVKDLRERSLVVALAGRRDLRKRELYLTADGAAVLREAQVGLARAEEYMFARLGIVNWRRFHDPLGRLAPRLPEPAVAARPVAFPRERPAA